MSARVEEVVEAADRFALRHAETDLPLCYREAATITTG